jgi:uncharacterized protein YcfJ
MVERNWSVALLLAAGTFVASLPVSQTALAHQAYCENFAREHARRATQGGTLGGAARGGIGGAVVGGIINGGRGAGRGAAIGALAGGATRGIQSSNIYDQAFRDCMRRQGR